MQYLKLTIALLTTLFVLGVANAQSLDPTLPRCVDRPTAVIEDYYYNFRIWCLERAVNDPSGGELAFTSLAFGDDGTLYATRPHPGQVFAITDSDDDGVPDLPQVIADNLTLPNGIAVFNNVVFVSGGANIYRIDEDGNITTIVNDLPAGEGFWTGDIIIGEDERIYVSTGASCDFCEQTSSERGAVLSYALDGTDKQILATGLRQPADLVFHNGELWVTDSARQDLSRNVEINQIDPDLDFLDEINIVEPGANFGFPYCVGKDNTPDYDNGSFDCADATAPVISFPTHSHPLGLASYTSSTFDQIENMLLVVLGGSRNRPDVRGYKLIAIELDEQNQPIATQRIIPLDVNREGLGYIPYDPETGTRLTQNIQYYGFSLWPHQPLDVAVSPEGWIYLSVGGGEILVLRPRAEEWE